MSSRETLLSAGIQALGAAHLAVGLTLALPGRVPPVLALGAGLGLFLLFEHLRPRWSMRERVAWGYLAPVGSCCCVRLCVAPGGGWDAAQATALALVSRVWVETPVSLYLLAAAYALTKPDPPLPDDPLVKPK